MATINSIVHKLLKDGNTPADIAETLDVSVALISTWKHKDNDFVPRLPIAKVIYSEYGFVTYPYSKEALDGT